MRSMTGFGRSQRDAHDVRATVEVKSVNHKGLDIKVRLPREAAVIEAAIVGQVKACIERGRVDVVLELQALDVAAVDSQAVLRLVHEVRALATTLDVRADVSAGDLLHAVLALRGTPATIDVQAALPVVLLAVQDALAALVSSRAAEGSALLGIVEQRLAGAQALAAQLHERLADAPARLSEKLRQRIEAAGLALDPVRLVQEAALLADRVDVTEELERLGAHVERGRQLSSSSSPVGRQLDFLCQELLREANTLGSKCQDAAAAHLVVELKSEIERLREQVQNVE